MKTITKDQFVALLDEAGVTEAQKKTLHARFEAQFPEQHRAFLEYLGVPAAQVNAIREYARKQ